MSWFRRRHEHRWINVAMDPSWETLLPGGGKQGKTLLLQRCRCGGHNTEMIMGNKWTRADLGLDDEKIRDLITLLDETED